MDHKAIIMWAFIGMLFVLPLCLGALAHSTRRQSRNGTAPSSGGLLGIDEFFYPSAHNARAVWEAEQIIPAPAPTPDKGPGVIEAGARITIEV